MTDPTQKPLEHVQNMEVLKISAERSTVIKTRVEGLLTEIFASKPEARNMSYYAGLTTCSFLIRLREHTLKYLDLKGAVIATFDTIADLC